MVFVLRVLTVTVSTRAMKLALSLLVLVACAHAIPIAKDTRTQTAQVDTPTVIVGSSQVDGKSDGGKVTLHLDQRSQIPEVPVVAVPKTEQAKQSAPQSVQVEEPKQEPVLTARNDIVPPKSDETIRAQPAESTPVKTELGARNEPTVSQEAPVIRVVEPQVTPQLVPVPPQRPVVVVEEVAVPVIPPQSVVLVVPEVPIPVQLPIIEQDIPQTIVQSVVVPEVPQTVAQAAEVPEVPQAAAVVPALEERSTPQVQTIPVIPSVLPTKESIEPETKVVPKQGEQHARNLKVDQAPVRAPIVISTIQKQIPVVEVKSDVQQPQRPLVPQAPKLEGKHAEVVPVVKSEPQVVKPQVQEQTSAVVLEERKSEEPVQEVKPILVRPLVVAEQEIRKEPVVTPVVLPQETSIRTAEIRETAQIQPVRVEPLAVPEQVIRKEPVVIPVVEPKETVRTSEIREPVVVQSIGTTEIREPVQVQETRSETVPVKSIPQGTVVEPVVQSQQTNTRTTQIRDEPVKVQSLPEEKAQ